MTNQAKASSIQEMDNLIIGLNIRFDIVTRSISDKEFYLNLHGYLDYVMKTKALSDLYDNSGRKYSIAFREIWGPRGTQYTEEELDQKSAKVTQLETFNLYAIAASINVRVYLPIEYYKTDTDPEWKQDPVALILVKGYKYTLLLNHWNKKELESYNRWFDGKRMSYEADLRRFHMEMLNEIEIYEKGKEKVEEVPSEVKPVINFDKERSILYFDEKPVNITIRNDKTIAHYVLEYIFENEEGLQAQSFYSEIIDTKFPEDEKDNNSIYRACNDIQMKVSSQAGISNFLIIKSGKKAYVQINPEYL